MPTVLEKSKRLTVLQHQSMEREHKINAIHFVNETLGATKEEYRAEYFENLLYNIFYAQLKNGTKSSKKSKRSEFFINKAFAIGIK